MGRWNTVDIIKIVFILVAISISALSWMFKQLAAQKKIKEARESAQRRQEQLLRTGRSDEPVPTLSAGPPDASTSQPPPSTHADARRRLQELAERRQRQLEELRRRQAGASPSAPPTARPSPAAAAPTPPVAHAGHSSAGRTETITTQSAQGTPTAFPELTRPPAPVERPSEAMPTRGKMARQTSKPPRQRAAKPVDQRPRYAADFQAQMEQAADKAVRDAKATAAAAADAKLDLASGRSRRTSPLGPIFAGVNAENVSAADWRRAIILREILDRPVSERADPYRDQPLSIL